VLVVGLGTLAILGASTGIVATSAAVGGSIGHYIGKSMKSDVWIEKTQKFRYNAPNGH
jgi:H+/Cl- antiporter ClcA